MTPAAAGGTYSLQALQDMLDVSRADVLAYVKAGFITPARGARNAYLFGFQDVVLLRTAKDLRAANMSTARIKAALQRVRALLPDEAPLTGLRITAMGDDIVVREQGQAIAVATGQLLFDFEVAAGGGAVLRFADAIRRHVAPGPAIEAPASSTVEDFIGRGAAHVDAGALTDALAAYDEGIGRHPANAELLFNRAVVLEDLGRVDEARAAYDRCIALEPTFADAHWNLARLYEQRGVKTMALRHFSAYRRLSR